MSRKYAAGTTVSPYQSRDEIERILNRFGATQFIYGWDEDAGVAQFGFRHEGRMYRFRLDLPDKDSQEFHYTETGRPRRSRDAIETAYDQAVRQRWRAMVAVIKAKLIAVEAGITTMEEAFLSQIMLADGRTVGEWVKPQLVELYESGQMPERLPGLDAPALTTGGA